jgi:hypothetical protein
MAETRVRIPVAVLSSAPLAGRSSLRRDQGPRIAQALATGEQATEPQSANTRTSTGASAAEPSTPPEHDTGCLIQLICTRLTQCPFATRASPDAPPLSLRAALEQCTDHLNLSGVFEGSLTTSRNDRGARTRSKRVSSVPVAAALWRATSVPYVSASAAAGQSAAASSATATGASCRWRIGDFTGLRLVESGDTSHPGRATRWEAVARWLERKMTS